MALHLRSIREQPRAAEVVQAASSQSFARIARPRAALRPAPRRAPIDSLQPHQAAPHAALPPRALDRTCEIWVPAPRTATTPSRKPWPTASRTRTSWRTASVKPTSTFSLGTTATSGVIGPRSPAAGRATTSARARRSARAELCVARRQPAARIAPRPLDFVGLNNTASYYMADRPVDPSSSSVWRALCRRAAAAASSHIHAAVVSASPWNSAWLMSYLTSLGAKAS